MSAAKHKCDGKTRSFWGTCERAATIEHGGKWFCWQHSPEREEKGFVEAREERMREHREQEQRIDRWDLRRDLENAADVRNLTDDELRKLAAFGGLRKILERLA